MTEERAGVGRNIGGRGRTTLLNVPSSWRRVWKIVCNSSVIVKHKINIVTLQNLDDREQSIGVVGAVKMFAPTKGTKERGGLKNNTTY